MKKLFVILLFIFSYKEIAAQNGQIRVYDEPSTHKETISRRDKFRLYTGATVGIMPLRLSGTMDKGNGNMSVSTTSIYTSYPQFRHVDKTAIVANLFVPVGFNIPVYRTKKWSTGFKLNAAIGFQVGVVNAEGLTAWGFDFPQFVYYRRYSGRIDYSVLAGWKYNTTALPYQLCLLGLDLNFDDTQFRFYFSPAPYIYYRELTNGTIEPALKIYEVGFGYFYYFGR